MSAAENPPGPAQLRQFLLGRLDEPERSRVEQFLLHSADSLTLIDSLEVDEELAQALRSLRDTSKLPVPPLVDELIRRMESDPALKTTLGAGATPIQHPPLARGCLTAGAVAERYSFLAPPQQPDELGRLGGYRILRELGVGGMGMVFVAEDPALQRRVALKVMKPEVAASSESRLRFLREAQAAAALDHEHIVPIYQVGEQGAGGVLFIAMPLLSGESLAARLKRERLLPLSEVMRIGRETAQGLAAAHAVGLIHRDIKPDNLWLHERPHAEPGEPRGQVKILDFGLARPMENDTELTRPGAMLGTPAYMAPEQADGLKLDGRSDLFSLGCVLYHLATGRLPFRGATLTAVLRAVAEHDPPPPHEVRPEIPPALSGFIMQLLAKDPKHRPESARVVVDTLRALEAGTPVPDVPSLASATIPVPPTDALPKPPRGQRKRALMLAFAGLVAAILFGIGRDHLRRLDRPPKETEPEPSPATYRGSVDVLVWSKVGAETRKLRLSEPGALPLKAGDQIRITAQVEPAGYVYLFWIDSEGAAVPVYPWQPGKWATRPPDEQPITRLDLPQKLTAGYTITGDQQGMETVVLLVRDAPLPADETELRRDLSGLPPQRPVQNPLAAVWFENGRVVEHDARRGPAHFVVAEINDPVLRLQELLRDKLQPRGRFTAAVSFARQGK